MACEKRGAFDRSASDAMVFWALQRFGYASDQPFQSSFLVRLKGLLSRPGLKHPVPSRVAEGKRGAEPPGATRSASLQREHGEDGEHRTFPGVSGMAHWRASQRNRLRQPVW
jgi:hypothetical protein